MRTIRWMAILGATAATACGGASTSPASSASALKPAESAALSYQAVGQDMATTIAQYQAATATMPDLTACQSAETAYEANIGPMIDRMKAVSATMDQYMAGAMGSAVADMACVAAAMSAEFDRHKAVACTTQDITADRTEAAQHASTMADWVDHQRVRYEQMGEAIGMMPSTTDTTWTCAQNADGTFTMDGQTWAPSQSPSSSTATSTPTTATPTANPYPWPTPCGGSECPCSGTGTTGGTTTSGTTTSGTTSSGTTTGGTTTGGTTSGGSWNMPGGPMM